MYTSLIKGWTGWDDLMVIFIGSIMETIGSTDTIGSTWMLSITWSKLGLSSSLMLPCIVVASSFYPPPPLISFEQVRSSSFLESIAGDRKIVLDFFFGNEVIGSSFSISFSVGGSMHVFSRWD